MPGPRRYVRSSEDATDDGPPRNFGAKSFWGEIFVALFATAGAEKATSLGEAPLVAITMGVITACFGGIIRDVLGKEDSIIFSREIYVTAAVVSAACYVGCNALDLSRELAIGLALVAGFGLRAGALAFGWSLPRYKPRAPDA